MERAGFREKIRTDSLTIVELLDLDVARVEAIEALTGKQKGRCLAGECFLGVLKRG